MTCSQLKTNSNTGSLEETPQGLYTIIASD